MIGQLVATGALIVAFLAVVADLILLRLWQAGKTSSSEIGTKFARIEAIIEAFGSRTRDELVSGREQSGTSARLLREEIDRSFANLSELLRSSMNDLRDAQKARLDGFERALESARAAADT